MAMTTASSTLSSFSSLSLHTSPRLTLLPFTATNTSLTKLKSPISLFLSSSPRLTTTTCNAEQPEIETTFFDNDDPEYEAVFEPPEAPEGFVPPPSFDEGSLETEDEVAAAYEELYGPAYSGMSVLGNDIYVMDAKVKKLGAFGKLKKEKIRDGFEERVVQVRRVTKVVKGGKQLHFRAVVVVGDKQGNVGVGVGKAKEVIGAVQKSAVNARRNIITVPMTKYLTFPHRIKPSLIQNPLKTPNLDFTHSTMAITTTSSSLSSLSLSLNSSPHHSLLLPFTTSFPKPTKPISLFLSSPRPTLPIPNAEPPHTETTFFSTDDPEYDAAFDPPEPPEGFVPPPSFDDDEPLETEEQIAKAYEELYGPAYSGVSVLGNDVYVMDSKVRKLGAFGKVKKEKIRDGFEERVVEVRRVTKVVKGGKQLHFRVIVVVGDKRGCVGVGVGKAKEVIDGVQKAAVNARRNIVTIPMTKYLTFPHRSEGDYGAAKVMLRPASPGTGVIAGGSVRIVLEMAGVENALGKQLGSKNALNNARATVVAVQKMRQFREVALDRGIPMEELWK